jgi:hypothetical protein
LREVKKCVDSIRDLEAETYSMFAAWLCLGAWTSVTITLRLANTHQLSGNFGQVGCK